MEYINPEESTDQGPKDKSQILCCDCGTLIEPNPANMCVICLRNHVDITEGIPKQAVLYFCKGCERYLQPPGEWVQCALESRDLLALCLKRLKGLKDVKLIDAGFIWTEPHSRRIKVKLTVHAEVFGGTMLQQVFIVEFSINGQMCDDCHRTEAKDYWRCLVQVRQRAENKKTFYYLEQLILKHRAHENTLGIKPIHGGLDFYYTAENHARKMVEFIQAMLPVKYTNSRRLISHDIHSNSYNYKYTFSIEIVPVSKDSLVCLNKKLQQQLGSIAPLCLVQRVANTIHLIDPLSAQIAEVSSTVYFRHPFDAVFNPKQLMEFVVMDVEVVFDKDRKFFPGQGRISNKHVLCDIWVVKASELGINDNTIHTKTHLGHLLKPGDSVLGYRLEDANVNNDDFEKLDRARVPDVILVRKYYGDKEDRSNIRNWKLKHLNEEATDFDKKNSDYTEFLEDLEEDPELRQNINIFKDNSKQIAVSVDEMQDSGMPTITLEEMLEDLVLDDVEMDDDESQNNE